MGPSTPSSGLTLSDYLRPIWRFKYAVIAVALVVAAATYAYSHHKPRTYQASTQLYVGQSQLQQILNPSIALTSRSVADEATLLTMPTVANRVIEKLGLKTTPQELVRGITVTPSDTDDFVTIQARNGSPTLAAKLADAFAQSFIQMRNADLVSSAKTALAQAQAQLAEMPKGSANTSNRSSLEQEIATLQAEVVSPPQQGEEVSPARVPSSPASPKPARDAIFALIIAFVLASVAAYLVDRSDRRLRSVDDVETEFGLPLLGSIPYVRGMGVQNGPPVTPHAAQEPYRMLRANLEVARQTVGRVIMVTSAMPSEGKSTVVRNLALSYREAGANVAVVEADLRRPVLADHFGLEHGAGIADALHGGWQARSYRVSVPEENGRGGTLDVVLAGAAHENPSVLLARDTMVSILREMAETHDIVLVDSPPLLSVSDGLTLLKAVDGVLIVIRPGTTTYPAVERVRRTVERTHGAPILGVVANGAQDELASYGYDYYQKPESNGNGPGSAVTYADDTRLG